EMYYALTEQGRTAAEQALEANRYVGPAPVPLEDYWDWVERQTIHQVKLELPRLQEVFSELELDPGFLHKIGPAVNSGRSMFLFGPSGNGKTVISNIIGNAFEDAVYIPYALYVYGQIIRLYDEVNHQPVPTNGEGPRHDPRWVLCRRPVVIVGGEMTEDSLELRFNPLLKFYEAPHQLRANNGVFIIFSTNLNPLSLADEAFLRRIHHKIYLGYVTPNQYLSIFRKVCQNWNMEFDVEIVREIMNRYYVATARPLSACHPRDLVEHLVDRARFLGEEPRLSAEKLDSVCQTYFIKGADIADYDTPGEIGEPRPLG